MTEAFGSTRRTLPTVSEAAAADDLARNSDEGSAAHEATTTRWAVDDHGDIRALSTFDLWMALSSGDLARDAKVWRVGREGWDRVLDVPELACALRDSLNPNEGDRLTLDYPIRERDLPAESGGRLELDSLSASVFPGHARSPLPGESLLEMEELELEPDPTVSPPEVAEDDPFTHAVVTAPPPPSDPPMSAAMTSATSTPSQQLPSEPGVRNRKRPRSRNKQTLAVLVACVIALSAGVALAAATPHIPQLRDASPNAAIGARVGSEVVRTEPTEKPAADPPAQIPSAHAKKSWSPTHRGQHRARQGTR